MLCLHLFQSQDDGDRRRNNFVVNEKVAGISSHHMTSCSDLTVTKLSLCLEVAYKIYLAELAVWDTISNKRLSETKCYQDDNYMLCDKR
jgi:hypothetical protein